MWLCGGGGGGGGGGELVLYFHASITDVGTVTTPGL